MKRPRRIWAVKAMGDEDKLAALLSNGWEPVGGFLCVGYTYVLRRRRWVWA